MKRLASTVILVLSLFVFAAPAQAAPWDEVKRYDLAVPGGGDWDAVVLREGTESWGQRHIAERHGWPEPADRCIAETLTRYNRTEEAGSSVTYFWDYAGDFGTYRVVVEWGWGDPQGIITAYSSQTPETCEPMVGGGDW